MMKYVSCLWIGNNLTRVASITGTENGDKLFCRSYLYSDQFPSPDLKAGRCAIDTDSSMESEHEILLAPDPVPPILRCQVQCIKFTEGSLEDAEETLLGTLQGREIRKLSHEDCLAEPVGARLLGFVENSYISITNILNAIISAESVDLSSQEILDRFRNDFVALDLLAKLIGRPELLAHIQHISLFLGRNDIKSAIDSAQKAKAVSQEEFIKILSRSV